RRGALPDAQGVVIYDTQLFNDRLQQWQNFYNYHRPHGARGGQIPTNASSTGPRQRPRRKRSTSAAHWLYRRGSPTESPSSPAGYGLPQTAHSPEWTVFFSRMINLPRMLIAVAVCDTLYGVDRHLTACVERCRHTSHGP